MSDRITEEDIEMAKSSGINVQPEPKETGLTSSHDVAIEEIRKRKEFGLKKYGTILTAFNGRDHLEDAKQEIIDLLVYVISEQQERESKKSVDSSFNMRDVKISECMDEAGRLNPLGSFIVELGLNIICEASGRQQIINGWRDSDRPFTEEAMLIVTEVSEAVEEWRNHHAVHEAYHGDKGKPEGIPSELADVIIRIGDLCQKYGVNLSGAFLEKFDFNFSRGYRHGGKQA